MSVTHQRTFAERHRFWVLFTLTVILLLILAGLSPTQLPVLQYKVTLPMLGGVAFYWLDHALYPFAQPDGYLDEDWMDSPGDNQGDADFPVARGYRLVFALVMLRQTLMVCAGALAVSMGL